MPRGKRLSTEGAILDYFRQGDAGEVKVVHKLATDIVRQRFAAPAVPKVRKTRTRKAASAADVTTKEVTQ